ncbi:unnamed protein product [Periconia digitata]|uniref:FAD-binding domain-containing protein n=1 Tax=Periconia digitata TaxID=1303443 RepID=A0A9W4XPW9_9PLEO|nr:unnamed protein product [Periconia digitata]
MSHEPFRVLIAGGGIAGLTLAIMLERFDIDYLLFEAYGDIAPAAGASIGLFPNGLRILDQIDCYEPLKKLIEPLDDRIYTRDENGKPITTLKGLPKRLEQRHGYPLMFFDRQWLLQVLYDQLKDKKKILINQKVKNISLIDSAVEVTCGSGQTFRGSIVVGADGVHSAVRKEMHRIGNQLEPGYFPHKEDDKIPCYYVCSYGIAQDVPGWVHGDAAQVLGKGHSQLVVSGPRHRVYWFFFSRLPEPRYGGDIPVLTRDDEENFIERYADTAITEDVTFGQLYAKRLTSTLTPLHEFVCKKWFFNRIIVLGDSAHKANPIGGQGGNSAIESATELVNALLEKRASHTKGLTNLNDVDVIEILRNTEIARHDRAEWVVTSSHQQQSLMASEKRILSKIFWSFLIRLKGNEAVIDIFSQSFISASRLKALPLKKRPRSIPYEDELPARPVKTWKVLDITVFGFLGWLLVAWIRNQTSEISSTHIGSRSPAHQLYVISQIIPSMLIPIVESYRSGNEGSPLALPSVFLLAMWQYGATPVVAVYMISHALLSFDSLAGRHIQLDVVQILSTGTRIGYVLLALLAAVVVWVCDSGSISGRLIYLAPLALCALTYTSKAVLSFRNEGQTPQSEKNAASMEQYRNQDMPYLRRMYVDAMVIQATVHVGTLIYTFGPLSNPVPICHCFDKKMFDTNLVVTAAACLLMSLYTVWSLRRLGYVTTWEYVVALLASLIGEVLVGPGAVLIGLWSWREDVLVRLGTW